MAKPTSALERFTSRYVVNPITGCWEWTGARSKLGYGCFRADGQNLTAYRWSYEHHVGAVPDGLELDHLCRVRACVNPDHLEAVTHRENILRSPIAPTAINARKTECVNGHPLLGDNLYVRPDGERSCRQCARDAFKRYQARKPAAIARAAAKQNAKKRAARRAVRERRTA